MCCCFVSIDEIKKEKKRGGKKLYLGKKEIEIHTIDECLLQFTPVGGFSCVPVMAGHTTTALILCSLCCGGCLSTSFDKVFPCVSLLLLQP